MSVKRQATTELNHENWDQEDPSEHEEMGSFKTASKDVLEKRVIRTAKRRQASSGDEPKKSVFSGFGGFNKTQPQSYDFLGKLTNGSKPTNGSPAEKSESAGTSTLFGNKTASSGIFSMPMSSSPATKTTFGIPNSQTSTLFGGTTNTTSGKSLFTASKTDTAGETPFKIQPTSTDTSSTDTVAPSKTTNSLTTSTSSSLFGTASPSANTNSSLFSSTNPTPFKIQPIQNIPKVESNFGVTKTTLTNIAESKGENKNDDKKLKYYAKLKGLNESVSDWIKKHVEETPLCILSPIFKDYEKYLKEIQAEYEGEKKEESNISSNQTNSEKQNPVNAAKAGNNTTPSLFSNTTSPVSKTSMFTTQNNTAAPGEKSTGFSFGISTTSSSTPCTTTSSGGFSFGITKTTTANTSSSFSLTTSTTTSGNGTAPFSFGIGKPFSFSPSVQNNHTEETKENNEEEDEPPKVEFTPVVEENSVFEKRCKIFVKKDGNFTDKGVGTLYIKKVEDSEKHQLLARANTNLGNVLLNLILSSSIPTQRLGKNNVMMVCIPTPDAKPPPTPILIRVKTPEEADDLLEILDKYKM